MATLFLYLLEGTLRQTVWKNGAERVCSVDGAGQVQEKPDQDNQAIVVQAGAAGARFILYPETVDGTHFLGRPLL